MCTRHWHKYDYKGVMQDYVSSAFATLLVILDPVFTSTLFLGVTHGFTPGQRQEVAWRGSVIAFIILLGAGLVGAKLLSLLGISLGAFRIAGGLLLLSSAAEMVFDRRSQRKRKLANVAVTVDHVKNIAAFPLAIPLIAGPGAITAMILLAGRAGNDMEKFMSLNLILLLVVAATYVSFRVAERLGGFIGVSGSAVLTRLLGIILAALAVQFIVDGVLLLIH